MFIVQVYRQFHHWVPGGRTQSLLQHPLYRHHPGALLLKKIFLDSLIEYLRLSPTTWDWDFITGYCWSLSSGAVSNRYIFPFAKTFVNDSCSDHVSHEFPKIFPSLNLSRKPAQNTMCCYCYCYCHWIQIFAEYLRHAPCMRQAQAEYESCADQYQLRIKTLNKVKIQIMMIIGMIKSLKARAFEDGCPKVRVGIGDFNNNTKISLQSNGDGGTGEWWRTRGFSTKEPC